MGAKKDPTRTMSRSGPWGCVLPFGESAELAHSIAPSVLAVLAFFVRAAARGKGKNDRALPEPGRGLSPLHPAWIGLVLIG